ncbi:MAG: hypothetical protein GPJ51_12420, partial [Candidatus Heimdallarchaeota archaeon]|nr:hypothetical protein [Candidatus Heimdallarchaeota archaeon]
IWGGSQFFGIILTVVILLIVKRFKNNSNLLPKNNNEEVSLKEFGKFALNNYTATLLQILPTWLTFPLVILFFSETTAAFIYMSWAFISILNALPNSLSIILITQKRDTSLKTLLNRFKFTALIISIIGTPLVIFQKFIFQIFDITYSDGYFLSFLFLVLSVFPLSIFLIYSSALRLKNEKGLLQILFLLQNLIYFGLIFILRSYLDIMAVNLSWLVSNIVVAIICLILSYKNRKNQEIYSK